MSAVVGIKLGKGSVDTWSDSEFRINTQHTEIYTVIMTTGLGLSGTFNETAEENLVANVVGVPRIGTESAILPGAFCIQRDINEVGPATWEVTALFDNTVKRADASNVDNNPWDLEPEWGWSSENMEVPLTFDIEDPTRAIQNSAGESLPPISTVITIPVLTIRRAELDFDDSIIDEYTNKRNSTGFWGRAKDTALMASIRATQAKRTTQKYWDVEYVIKFCNLPEGWNVKLLDEGTYYWVGGVNTGIKQPFGDDAFQQIVGNLNGFGGKNTTSVPAFVDPPFRRYDKADFNTLNLGPWTWA
jgi:hypothetical protein